MNIIRVAIVTTQSKNVINTSIFKELFDFFNPFILLEVFAIKGASSFLVFLCVCVCACVCVCFTFRHPNYPSLYTSFESKNLRYFNIKRLYFLEKENTKSTKYSSRNIHLVTHLKWKCIYLHQ